MGLLIRYFLRGLLVVVPAAATIWILVTVFVFVDDLVQLPVESSWTIPGLGWEIDQEDLAVRGVGFLVTVALITLVGALTSNFFTRWIFAWSERVFTRVPGVKLLYNAIKDMIEAFVSEKKRFDKPVLLSLGAGMEAAVIGFVTHESLEALGLEDKVAVYVPQSYNFAANLIVVDRSRITPIDQPAADVMAFVVSGGVSALGGKSEEAD